MTPISLMPPVDYCPSCEGRKAEIHAQQIGEARAEKAEQRAAADALGTPPPGATADQPAGGNRQEPVATAVQTLLAPDLSVQASLSGSATEPGAGEDAANRLRAAQAYGAA